MRLVDAILRQGHLSEAAIVDALITGERPAHLDQCDICAGRALSLGRGLDTVRSAAIEAADQVFPPERLAAQEAQILRRLEQLDEPAKVIAFPVTKPVSWRPAGDHRVAPAWVGVAAAAGLIIGAIGGHGTALLTRRPAGPAPTAGTTQPAQPPALEGEAIPTNVGLVFDMDLESFVPEPLGTINELTPRTTLASLNTSTR